MQAYEKRALARKLAPIAAAVWDRYRALRKAKRIPEAPDGLRASQLLAFLVEHDLAECPSLAGEITSHLDALREGETFEETRPAISIIIPSLNTREVLQKCILATARHASLPTEIIVVDGGSRDGSVEAVLQARDAERMIREPTVIPSRSFSMSANEGARRASGRTLIFLNSDTIPTARWDEALLDALGRENVAAAGPTSNAVKGAQLNPRAMTAYADEDGLREFAWAETTRQWGKVQEAEFLSGFCLAVKADRWDEIGEFDERFEPGNFEDDDWCLRALARGYRLLIAKASYVHHYGQASFQANAISYRPALADNHRRMAEKWGPEILAVPGA